METKPCVGAQVKPGSSLCSLARVELLSILVRVYILATCHNKVAFPQCHRTVTEDFRPVCDEAEVPTKNLRNRSK